MELKYIHRNTEKRKGFKGYKMCVGFFWRHNSIKFKYFNSRRVLKGLDRRRYNYESIHFSTVWTPLHSPESSLSLICSAQRHPSNKSKLSLACHTRTLKSNFGPMRLGIGFLNCSSVDHVKELQQSSTSSSLILFFCYFMSRLAELRSSNGSECLCDA